MASNPEKAAKRRHPDHDYYSKCIYLISINKSDEMPVLCELRGVPGSETDPPREHSFRPGLVFKWELKKLVRDYPQVRIIQYIVMPEHVHFIIEVLVRTEYHLGTLIGELKARCTKSYGTHVSFFEPGFNDRILFGKGQLNRMIKYVQDNPRRRLVKRLNPELFRSVQTLEVSSENAQEQLKIFGNANLLLDPTIDFVKVSRKYTAEELRKRKWAWYEIIRQDGVLVSPFIHQDEKRVKEYAIEQEAKIILITRDYLGERYKPAGRLFDLCAEGRLLVVSVYDGTQEGLVVKRAEAERMNDLARLLAGPEPKTYRLLPRR